MPTKLIEVVKQDLVHLNAVFRLLSDPTRLSILLVLMDQNEHNVSALCDRIGLPQPTISHHLALMRSNNLVECRRQGKHIYYKAPHLNHNGDGKAELSILLKHSAIRLAFLHHDGTPLEDEQ